MARKLYDKVIHIVVPNEEIGMFQPAVSTAIGQQQEEGLTVEVQYQMSGDGCSALILGYKEI